MAEVDTYSQLKMKRFLVFGCAGYYPAGGWGDFERGFETRQEAKDYIKEQKKIDTLSLDYEIVDLMAEGII